MKIHDVVKEGLSERYGANRPHLGSKRDQFKSLHKWRKQRGLSEFAPSGGGGSGDYLRALASAWYNGVFDTGSLPRGIKTQEDVERLLNRGIVCPDGKTRKLHIDYNSDFDGVVIYSDDYYEHGDESGELDSRTGQPFGPYDHMEFAGDELDEGVAEGSLNEFAPAGGGGNIPRGPKTPRRGPWDDGGEDPYQLRRYNRSADFFDQFDSDGVDKQKFDKATGEYEGYYFDRDAASGITQIAYFKFDDPTKIGDNDPGIGWYYEPIDEGFLNEFAPGSGGDDDHQDPYGAPKPEHYDRSIDFFGQFEADHFDDEDMNDATGEFKGYWYYDGKPRQIAYFKFDNPRRTGSNHPGVGWYYEPQNEGVAEGALNEFAPDSNDGGEEDALHKYAKMWWAGDEATQLQIEKVLDRMGWEIGEDEGSYDNGGVFVVRAGDVNGNSYISWPAEELTEAHHFIYEGLWDKVKQVFSKPPKYTRPTQKTGESNEDFQARVAAAYSKYQDEKSQYSNSASPAGPQQQQSAEPPPQTSDNDYIGHGTAENELRMFIAGQKPAAIVSQHELPNWKNLIDSGKYVIKQLTAHGRPNSVIIAQPGENQRVEQLYKLVQNATDAGDRGDFRAYENSNYHRWVGKLLGYPEDKINAFIEKYFRNRTDLAKKPVYEGEPITTTPGSIEPGGAVDNFKQQMANRTEVDYQKQQAEVAEGDGKPEPPEADYGADYQDMVQRVKRLAGLGPLKTVYDPRKRVYRNVPTAVQPRK